MAVEPIRRRWSMGRMRRFRDSRGRSLVGEAEATEKRLGDEASVSCARTRETGREERLFIASSLGGKDMGMGGLVGFGFSCTVCFLALYCSGSLRC